MVRLLLLRFATSLTLRNRVSNTIHDVLTISGSSYSTRTTLVLVHIASQIAYKYMMADQENLLSVLSGIPWVIAFGITFSAP